MNEGLTTQKKENVKMYQQKYGVGRKKAQRILAVTHKRRAK